MHAELGDADIHRGDADACRCQRSDRGAAGHVGAGYEYLQWHASLLGGIAQKRLRCAGRRIALVRIHLQHRTCVQQRTVAVVVLVGVVRMHAMCVVGRDEDRGCDATRTRFRVWQQPCQYLLEERALSTIGRRATDLLVVVQYDQRRHPTRAIASTAGLRTVLRVHKRLGCRVAAHQIVQPCTGDELVAQADHARRLVVVQAQFEVEHVELLGWRRRSSQLFCKQGSQIHIAAAQQGWDVGLWIDAALLIHLTIQMNRKTGDERQRAAEVDEAALERTGRGTHMHPPGDAEIAVEPGVQQRAAVDLQAEPCVATPLQDGVRFQP